MARTQHVKYLYATPLFDRAWYLKQYPDVAESGCDPAEHYLVFGAAEGRDPGPQFDTSWYLESNPWVRAAGVNPLLHYLSIGQYEGRAPRGPATGAMAGTPHGLTAADLVDRLWGGFPRQALAVLSQIMNDAGRVPLERIRAAWEMMRWYFQARNDCARALECADFIRSLQRKPIRNVGLLEVECLINAGRFDAARRRLDEVCPDPEENRRIPAYLLLKATLARHPAESAGGAPCGEDDQLSWLNQLCKLGNIAPLRKKDAGKPLSLSNVTADAKPVKARHAGRVSVIMAVYNGEATILAALESLTAQTWRNLEVIVVDDASTDGTIEIVSAVMERDPRIKLVKRTVNGGAFAARNAGLAHVTGKFVTTHDSDDWSHPQKIEMQMRELETHKECVAALSHFVRLGESLQMGEFAIMRSRPTTLSYSSLLFRAEVLDRLKHWDAVRLSADGELSARLVKYFGPDAVCGSPYSAVLTIALARKDSLTQSRDTHVTTCYYGLRWLYKDSYLYWHSHESFSGEPGTGGGRRHIPAVLGNEPVARGRDFDVVILSDLATRGGALAAVLKQIEAACETCRRVGVVHWRTWPLDPARSLDPRVYELCAEHDACLIPPGMEVRAETLIIGSPYLLQYPPDPLPKIAAERLIVLMARDGAPDMMGEDLEYDETVVRTNLREIFGHEGEWIPELSGNVEGVRCADGLSTGFRHSPE